MSNRNTPTINAGSMADIAFLLLIFFLVTTTMDDDIGIQKMLPEKNTKAKEPVHERNVLEIAINANNEIQLEGATIIPLKELKQFVIDFIDNGATTDQQGNPCDWCNGKKEITSSDHPAKAVIALETSRNTSYGTYIATHNEINNAYTTLRSKLAFSQYGMTYKDLIVAYKKDKNNSVLKAKVEDIRTKYPLLIVDNEPMK